MGIFKPSLGGSQTQTAKDESMALHDGRVSGRYHKSLALKLLGFTPSARMELVRPVRQSVKWPRVGKDHAAHRSAK
jgi:hypothetical protein